MVLDLYSVFWSGLVFKGGRCEREVVSGQAGVVFDTALNARVFVCGGAAFAGLLQRGI